MAATYNGYFVNFYENGAPLGSTVAATGNIYSSSGYNPFIGTYASAAIYFFSGSIADLQVYNTTLDANQMMALYTKGIGGSPVASANIVGWWPLNGNAIDLSPYGNNGVAYNILYGSPSPYTVTFGSNIPAQGSQTFNVVGTDLGTTIPFVFNSVGSTVQVSNALTAVGISPSVTQYIDPGQSVPFTSSVTGGSPVITYQWRSDSSSCTIGRLPIQYATSNTYSASPPAGTATYYCLTATDGATSNEMVTSAETEVVSNYAQAANVLLESNSILDFRQSATLTAGAAGGTPSYSFNWFSGAGCSGAAFASGMTTVVTPAASAVYSFNSVDSASVNTAACSASNTIFVRPTINISPYTTFQSGADMAQATVQTYPAADGVSFYVNGVFETSQAGQLVYQLGGLSPGTYNLTAYDLVTGVPATVNVSVASSYAPGPANQYAPTTTIIPSNIIPSNTITSATANLGAKLEGYWPELLAAAIVIIAAAVILHLRRRPSRIAY